MNDPIPAWPGEPVALASGEVYVRSAPADVPAGAAGAQPALFVHGLGGSATNWTDLMELLRRPAAAGLLPAARPRWPARRSTCPVSGSPRSRPMATTPWTPRRERSPS